MCARRTKTQISLGFVIPFNLICNMTNVLKKLNFDLLTPSPGSGGGGGCGQNICYHVAVFVIPFNLKYNIIMFWKEFSPFDPTPRVKMGGWGWVCGKIFATMLLHSRSHLVWFATWPCSEKVEFWHIDPIPRVGRGGSVDKIFPLILPCSSFSFIWYATWPRSENV